MKVCCQTFHAWRQARWTEQPHLSSKYLPRFKGFNPCEQRLLWLARLTPCMLLKQGLVRHEQCIFAVGRKSTMDTLLYRAALGGSDLQHTLTPLFTQVCDCVLHTLSYVHIPGKGRAWLIDFPHPLKWPQNCLFNFSALDVLIVYIGHLSVVSGISYWLAHNCFKSPSLFPIIHMYS